MPELPEVETIKRGLDQLLIGQVITGVDVAWAKSMPDASTAIGHTIQNLDRRGKVLIINLDQDMSLLFHLKMTGQLVFDQKSKSRFVGGHPTPSMQGSLPDSSTRVVFSFKSGDKLFFNDQRKFGWIKIVPAADVNLDTLLMRMGPEPLSSRFSLKEFVQKVTKSRAPIKAIILDQSVVAGVGNIYADESLHLAKIHPARPGSSLKSAEIQRLYAAIKDIIALGIEYGGTSFTNYVNALGTRGDYLQNARVFRKNGHNCAVCGTEIQKIRVAGRGTHFCPLCQSPLRVISSKVEKSIPKDPSTSVGMTRKKS